MAFTFRFVALLNNRLAGKPPFSPESDCDADWIGGVAANRCVWANIPSRSSRTEQKLRDDTAEAVML
jgi:hypothetical protein